MYYSLFFSRTDILGDFNRIKNAENFELAMSAMWDVVEMLTDAQEQLPFDGNNYELIIYWLLIQYVRVLCVCLFMNYGLSWQIDGLLMQHVRVCVCLFMRDVGRGGAAHRCS